MRGVSRRQAGVAIGALVAMAVSSYPILLSTFPVFLQPVSEEFGWGRADMSSALLFGSPVMALLHPVVGQLLDRFGARRVLLTGFFGFGLFMAAFSQLNGSVPQLLAIYVCAAAFSCLPAGVAIARVVASNFDNNRGLFLGLCLGVGGGMGAAVMPPLANFFVDLWGWRGAYVGIGLIPILIGLPTVFFLVREPGPARTAADAAAAPGLTASEAMRKPAFLMMMGATFLSCGIINGTAAHMSAIMTDRGFSAGDAALVLSVFAVAMMCGQFGIGTFLDRIQTPRLALPVFGAVLAGIVLLQISSAPLGLILGVALVGAGAGSEYALLPYYLTRFFGVRAFGLLYGVIYSSAAIASGIGPFMMGKVFDVTGSYAQALITFEVLMGVTLLLIARLPRYAYAPDGTLLNAPLAKSAAPVNAA